MTTPTQAQEGIVKRLRKTNYYLASKEQLSMLILDAADEIERLTAAAQVGEQHSVDFEEGIVEGYKSGWNAAFASTIERCAQWLTDQYGAEFQGAANAMRRALKEQP